jgi:DNA-binding transcriptional LysR family regulator
MSAAARELHLTQSGVSQHMKALEDTLGVPLFDRLNRKLIPTSEGEKLFQFTNPALFTIQEGLIELTQAPQSLSGVVRIGMPVEFGINIIIPLLAEIGREYKDLEFNLQLDFAAKMNEELLQGNLDFAFVDDFAMDRRIKTKKVTEETFLLCCSKKYFDENRGKKEGKSYFETLDYLAYQDNEHVLRGWFQHHTKRKNLDLKIRARVMDVEGLSRFVVGDLGVGILPDHKVEKLEKYGYEIKVFEGSSRPYKNTISLAYLDQRQQPPHVSRVLEIIESKFK